MPDEAGDGEYAGPLSDWGFADLDKINHADKHNDDNKEYSDEEFETEDNNENDNYNNEKLKRNSITNNKTNGNDTNGIHYPDINKDKEKKKKSKKLKEESDMNNNQSTLVPINNKRQSINGQENMESKNISKTSFLPQI